MVGGYDAFNRVIANFEDTWKALRNLKRRAYVVALRGAQRGGNKVGAPIMSALMSISSYDEVAV